MRDRFEEISRQGAAVLAISFARPEELEKYRAQLALPFAIAADPGRQTYRRYGLFRGSPWAVWHPRVLWQYARLILRGARFQRAVPGEDLRQLGGDFVVGPSGRIRYARPSRRPDDRPSLDALLRVLREG